MERSDAPSEAVPIDLYEVSGTIKWFDVAKGYGFIVPDNGGPDVLLHVTCMRRDGFQTANEGARIVCEAQLRPKGAQAFRVRREGDGVVETPLSARELRR